jgi:hypothetical protein
MAGSWSCMQYWVATKVKKNPGWLQIRIMCPSGMACLPVDSCFWVSLHYKNPTEPVWLVQNRHHLIEIWPTRVQSLNKTIFLKGRPQGLLGPIFIRQQKFCINNMVSVSVCCRLTLNTQCCFTITMCPSGMACLPVDSCFWVSLHYKNPTEPVWLVQNRHHLIEIWLDLAMIWRRGVCFDSTSGFKWLDTVYFLDILSNEWSHNKLSPTARLFRKKIWFVVSWQGQILSESLLACTIKIQPSLFD